MLNALNLMLELGCDASSLDAKWLGLGIAFGEWCMLFETYYVDWCWTCLIMNGPWFWIYDSEHAYRYFGVLVLWLGNNAFRCWQILVMFRIGWIVFKCSNLCSRHRGIETPQTGIDTQAYLASFVARASISPKAGIDTPCSLVATGSPSIDTAYGLYRYHWLLAVKTVVATSWFRNSFHLFRYLSDKNELWG